MRIPVPRHPPEWACEEPTLKAPFVVAGAVVVAGLATAAHVAVAGPPPASDSAAVIALGLLILTLVATAGLLVARGRWSRWLSAALAVTEAGIVAFTEPTGWGWLALAGALVALGGLAGRWLDGWLRPRPSATGPDPLAVALRLGLIALVPLVGLSSPSGLTTAHGLLGAAAVVLAWAYGKAKVWGLWGVRLGLLPLAVPAVLASPPIGAVARGAAVVTLVALSWTPTALRSVQPLMDSLPGPRKVTSRRDPHDPVAEDGP